MSSPIQLTLRLPADQASRLDAIAAAMSGPAVKATRAEAVRYVLERGYENAERDLGIKASAGKKGTK
jgi:predicted transcriptional regulator